jgi:hypothetical protein
MALRAALCALKLSSKAQIRARSIFNAIKKTDKQPLANVNILFNQPNIVHTNIVQYAVTRRKLRIKTTKEDPQPEKKTDVDKTPKNEPVVKDVAYYFDKGRNLGNKLNKNALINILMWIRRVER